MKKMTAQVLVPVIVISLLILPTGLSAKERRGATLIVAKLDGSQIRGELIAVKENSLVLLWAPDKVESIGLAQIKTVRIVRKSRAGLLASIGGAVAALSLGGYVLAAREEDDYREEWAALIGGVAGAIGAVTGLLVGTAMGLNSSFTVAGEPEAVVTEYWNKLRAYSREGRLPRTLIPPMKTPAPRPPDKVANPKVASASSSRLTRGPRLKIGVAATFPIAPHGYWQTTGSGSFLFPGAVPPGEEGPYSVDFSLRQVKQLRDLYYGPVSLAYEWTEHLSAEVEFIHSGTAWHVAGFIGNLEFTSTADGRDYYAYYASDSQTSFFSVLVGLTYRTKTPSAFSRHIFEIGAAGGPAVGRMSFHPMSEEVFPLQSFHKIALAGRIHGAYDFYILPALSVGAFAGYRYLELRFPGWTGSAEVMFSVFDPPANTIVRLTEITFPGRTIRWNGLFLGLRIGFRL